MSGFEFNNSDSEEQNIFKDIIQNNDPQINPQPKFVYQKPTIFQEIKQIFSKKDIPGSHWISKIKKKIFRNSLQGWEKKNDFWKPLEQDL